MKINNKPAAVLFGDFYRMSKFETILIGMLMGSDPEHSFRLHSKYIPVKGGMGRNSIAYESAAMDKALDDGVRDIDREKRKKAYFRAQEIFADELPYLPIFHYVNIRGARKGVEGFRPNSNMQEYSWNTNEWWIKKG
jgi:peptide/nickel transport system substrate-binding protein